VTWFVHSQVHEVRGTVFLPAGCVPTYPTNTTGIERKNPFTPYTTPAGLFIEEVPSSPREPRSGNATGRG
jgi:hypothetical protein